MQKIANGALVVSDGYWVHFWHVNLKKVQRFKKFVFPHLSSYYHKFSTRNKLNPPNSHSPRPTSNPCELWRRGKGNKFRLSAFGQDPILKRHAQHSTWTRIKDKFMKNIYPNFTNVSTQMEYKASAHGRSAWLALSTHRPSASGGQRTKWVTSHLSSGTSSE